MSGLHALLQAPLDELRTQRLPELFQCIDHAEESDVPLLTALVDRAFEGADGLAVLRQDGVQHAIRDSALAHPDPSVRCFALMLCRRLTTTPSDVRTLCESGVMPAVAGLVSESSLAVAEKAAQVVMACAKAPDVLKAVLDHPPTLQRLLAPCATAGSGSLSTAGLRTLAVFAEAAAAGEEQYALCEASGALAPALAAWNSSDMLVRLNALEVFALLARRKRGMAWLASSGALQGMLAIACGGDTGEALAALHLPAVLHCLAELLEHNDDDQAASAVLGADGLLLRSLWPKIEPSAGHGDGVREATLSLVRAAGCSRAGLVLVLTQLAEQGEHAGLRKQLRASNERARVGALGVVAQLCSSSARYMDYPIVSQAQPTLRSLFASVSPSESTGPGDALAAMASLPSPDLRVASTRLLRSLVSLDWGATHLAQSEAVLDLLTHSGRVQLSPDELREKHGLAVAMAESPHVLAVLGAGSGVVRRLHEYAAAGPFAHLPRAEPGVMGPMTI